MTRLFTLFLLIFFAMGLLVGFFWGIHEDRWSMERFYSSVWNGRE